jgi:hypothetical protein
VSRYEFKYLAPLSQLSILEDMFSPWLDPDPHGDADTGRYTVHSIYFDTPDLRFYREKVEGIMNRFKLRMRGYENGVPGSNVFFEIKRKNNMVISKTRHAAPVSDVENIIGENAQRDGNTDTALSAFLYHMDALSLSPSALIRYDRTAFVDPSGGSVRVTFDTSLRTKARPTITELYSTDDIRDVMEDQLILEVKFENDMPQWLEDVMDRLALQRTSVSKYANCIECLGLHAGVGGNGIH